MPQRRDSLRRSSLNRFSTTRVLILTVPWSPHNSAHPSNYSPLRISKFTNIIRTPRTRKAPDWECLKNAWDCWPYLLISLTMVARIICFPTWQTLLNSCRPISLFAAFPKILEDHFLPVLVSHQPPTLLLLFIINIIPSHRYCFRHQHASVKQMRQYNSFGGEAPMPGRISIHHTRPSINCAPRAPS